MKKLIELQKAMDNGKLWFYYNTNTTERVYITEQEYQKSMRELYNDYMECNECDYTYEDWCNHDDFYHNVELEICNLETMLNE